MQIRGFNEIQARKDYQINHEERVKNTQFKAIQIGGYLRIIAIAIAIMATLIFGSKAFAIAPHMPDMGLQAEVDHHRDSVEKSKDRKSFDKVKKHKDYKKCKIKDKGKHGAVKEKIKGKKTQKTKTPKVKKPPKPSKSEKKRASRHRARNLS